MCKNIVQLIIWKCAIKKRITLPCFTNSCNKKFWNCVLSVVQFTAESQQNFTVDKDTTLPASARKVKTLGLKVRSSYILPVNIRNLWTVSLKIFLKGIVFD